MIGPSLGIADALATAIYADQNVSIEWMADFEEYAVVLVTTAALMLATGSPIDPGTPLHRALLIVVSYVYFGFAWTRSGQTLGMKTWRIRVRTFDDRPLTWGRAALRFTTAALSWAALGLGFAWMLVDRQSMTWHDRLSRTVLVKVPRA